MDATQFMQALDQIEETRGISKESVIVALKESLRKAIEKSLFGGAYEGSDIRIEISEDPAKIEMKYVRKIVEGEVEDDFLEISLEDANKGKKGKKYVAGDEYVQEISVDEMTRLMALTVKSVLKQKLAEAEKQSLYESHKDKIGEMITGTVEKCDDRGAIVNIGRTSLYLTRKELIGDEMLTAGAPVRLYVSDVSSGEQGKAPMVRVSRSDAGFLRRLFEEEVREIYDGTVIIKALARKAGIRSKVAVYSNDPNVDCVGCCIGVNGSAIQKIVAQLGNSRDKEKIDIISYSPNEALFVIDALRPATVLKIGLYEDEEGQKCAYVVVPVGQSSLAIGRKGANVSTACKLTGVKIEIVEEDHESEIEVPLKSVEQVQIEEKERAQKEKYENYLAKVKAARQEEVAITSGVEKAKPQKILDEEIKESKPTPEAKVEAKVEQPEEVEIPEIKPTEVKTTTTLASLEASLESDKRKEEFKATQKTSRRPRKITEEEVEHEVKPIEVEKKQPQMDIYTKEELEELENEELYDDEYYDEDEDIDFDDFDKYYDDDK